MSLNKNRMNSRFWFSELESEDIDAGCSALRSLVYKLKFAVIGKEKPGVYNKCILIFKNRIFYSSIPDIFKKKYCERIPFVGKSERKTYLKNLTVDVTSNGIRLQIGDNPADVVPEPRKHKETDPEKLKIDDESYDESDDENEK